MTDHATNERRAWLRSIRLSVTERLLMMIGAKVRRWQASRLETPYQRMAAALRQENAE